MEETQDQDVQETPEEVTISKKELEDLKHRAEVSSQNFERLKSKEKELEDLKSTLQENDSLSDSLYSDEAKKLRDEIRELKNQITSTTSGLEKDKIYSQFPVLKEHEDAFRAFSEDPINQSMPLATRAKAFMVENDLLQKEPKRKGLEKPTGGKVTKAPSGKITAEDARRLRETNPRKYMAMIENGTLDISDD